MKGWILSRSLLVSIAPIALLTVGVAPQLKLHNLMADAAATPPQTIEQNYAQQLEAAQQEASRNQLPAALERIAGIPRNSQHFDQASRLQSDWSKELLRQATAQYRQGDVQAAQAAIAAIPNTGSIAPQLQARQQQWKTEIQQLAQVTAAQSNQDWDGALQALAALRGSELYNTPKVQAMVAQTLDRAANPTVMIASATPTATPTASTTTPMTFTSDVDAPKLDIAPPKPAALAVDVDTALQISRPIERLVNARPAPLPQAALAISGKPIVRAAAIRPAQPGMMTIATAETAETVSLPKPVQVAVRPAPVPARTPPSTPLLVKPDVQASEVKPTAVAAMSESEGSLGDLIEVSVPASENLLPTVSSDAVESIDAKIPNLDFVETNSEEVVPVVELETVLPAEATLPEQISPELPSIETIPLAVSELQPPMVSTPEIDTTAIEVEPIQPLMEQPIVKQGETGSQLKQQEQPPAQI